ncbi:MAG: hypothetical protein IJ689_06630 [Alphaproteobacteria bacterium]|nr:hypothetical protein [Alphaproteobacteria bacterium]
MIKKIFAVALMGTLCGCVGNTSDKTPQTQIGKLNSCMLDKAYDMNKDNSLFKADKWTTARQILTGCEHKLNINSHDVNEKQSLNIIVSVIDSMRQ